MKLHDSNKLSNEIEMIRNAYNAFSSVCHLFKNIRVELENRDFTHFIFMSFSPENDEEVAKYNILDKIFVITFNKYSRAGKFDEFEFVEEVKEKFYKELAANDIEVDDDIIDPDKESGCCNCDKEIHSCTCHGSTDDVNWDEITEECIIPPAMVLNNDCKVIMPIVIGENVDFDKLRNFLNGIE